MVISCTGTKPANWLTWEPQQNAAWLLQLFANFLGYPDREKAQRAADVTTSQG